MMSLFQVLSECKTGCHLGKNQSDVIGLCGLLVLISFNLQIAEVTENMKEDCPFQGPVISNFTDSFFIKRWKLKDKTGGSFFYVSVSH